MDLAQFIVEASHLWHRLFCRSSASSPPSLKEQANELGKHGERLAERFLKKHGYKILYRNFRPHYGGEVDLVCRVRRKLELVFVEVKTRSSEKFGAPQEAVDYQKQRGIVQAAQEWLEMLDRNDVIARFDIIEIIQHERDFEIRHLKNAFLAEETLHPGSLPINLGATPKHVRPTSGYANGEPFPPRDPHC